MRLSEISTIVQGDHYGENVDISTFSIDTRTLQPGDLYIAIKGEHFNGNEFVDKAQQAGAAAALVENGITAGLPYIKVADTRVAMAELAAAWRSQFSLPIVAITGSNGKTTVKEMIAAILGVNAEVLFTQGNLNNDIGVPLTLLRLNAQHQFAVVEMGANHPDEIAFTSRLAQADVAVLTNVGLAHIQGFGDLDGVARSKGEIIESLTDSGVAILNADDDYFAYWQTIAGAKRIVSFGLSADADVCATEIQAGIYKGAFQTEFKLHALDNVLKVRMHLAGNHNVLNALAATAACLTVGVDAEQIKQGLEKVQPEHGRLQAMPGRQGSLVIDDSYNANPTSLKAALEVLTACHGEPWVVLGAFAELGIESKQMHEKMGELLKSMGVMRLLAVGPDAENTVRVFGKGAAFFDNQQELIENVSKQLKGNEVVLVKGSRSQHMENVVAALVDNYRV